MNKRKKSSIFTKIMSAGLLPTLLIFSSVFTLIVNTVYNISANSATDRAVLRAEQTSQLLSVKLMYLPNLLNLTCDLMLQIDRDAPDARQRADDVLLMFIEAYPDIYNAWFVFEEGVFGGSGRFTKSYIHPKSGVVEEVFDMGDDVLADPSLSPWYNVPLTTGKPYLYSLDYYDYGDGGGPLLVDTAATPIIQGDGQIIGCVGFDVLFDNQALEYVKDMEVKNERKTLIFREDGLIMYSAEPGERFTGITEYQFKNMDLITQSLENGTGFIDENISPFFNKKSLICVYPIDIENDSTQLYFYMDIPMHILHGEADRSIRAMALASVASLVLAVGILLVIARNIVRPIRSITESARKISDGDVEQSLTLYDAYGKCESNDEIDILGATIKNMLYQLNEAQQLKLEKLELIHKKEKAEAQAHAKGDFVARMSHEIRTPMNAIVGITELVLRENISPEVYEHVTGIKAAGNNLLSIINDILDFSKIDSGKLEIVDAEYIFPSLINDVINIIRIRTSEKPLFFVVNLNSNIPNKMIGDEGRVRQILLNLLSNAVKYTNEGFVSLTIDGEIRGGDSVLISIEIADSGIGIKPDDIDKLFGDFVRVDMVSHKGVQGTGLGLAITKSLCLAMGGDISVYSDYGKGSVFNVTLTQKIGKYEKLASVVNPSEKKVLLYETREIYADSIACAIDNLNVECVLAHDREEFFNAMREFAYPFVFVSSFLFEEAKKIISETGANSSIVLLAEYGGAVTVKNVKTIAMPVHSISIANILNDVTDAAGYGGDENVGIGFSAPSARILIVDDILTNLKVAEGLISPYNMKVDTCTSGEAAIKMVKSTKYDVIFMDHMMPEMDGIEATRRIRAIESEYCASVPIVALTANAISGVCEMFIQNGMNDFIAKPIEMSKLNAVLDKWIPDGKKEKLSERKADSSPAPFEIEGLDVKAGLAASGGNADRYIATLSILCGDIREKLAQIAECTENGNTELYTVYVHALKSALAGTGARELSAFAGRLEDAGRNRDLEYINSKTEIFTHSLEILRENIERAVSGMRAGNGSAGEIDKTLLLRLKDALDNIDVTEAGNIMAELQSKNPGGESGAVMEEIDRYILLFDYDKAQTAIDSLLKQEEVV